MQPMAMMRPFVSFIRRNRSKTIYGIFALALVTLVFLNGERLSQSRVQNGLRVDSFQGQPSSGRLDSPRNVATEARKNAKHKTDERNQQSFASDEFSEYKKREDVAFKACREKKNSGWLDDWPLVKNEPKFPHSPMISTKTDLFYCPVGKVASSFFTRWVLAMNKDGPMTSPYDIAMKDAGRGRAESLASLKSKDKKIEFLQRSTKIIFGRNPYSRIFSAYVDKLFSPNPFYWGQWAKKAIGLDNNMTVTKCGSNVTFAQFVNAVVQNLAKTDVHLVPVTLECNACQTPYNVVGKLENTIEDLDYASKLLNISSSFQHQSSYKTTAQNDVILDAVNSAFSWKQSIKQCGVSLDEMGQRMWRKFQIRGVIDSSIGYPFKRGSIERMSTAEFIKVSQKAIHDSTDRVHLKKQRTLAMQLAYSSVPKELILKIQKVYELDFAYFDYQKDASFISEGENVDVKHLRNHSVIFLYGKPWIA